MTAPRRAYYNEYLGCDCASGGELTHPHDFPPIPTIQPTFRGVFNMPSRIPVSRRSFIQTTGAAAAAATWTANSYAAVVGANEKIRVGFIGAGGMANAHMNTINDLRKKNNVESVAVADCWKTRAEQGAKKVETKNVHTD
ncbi:MAG: twin-arginine translocation signal domain-containing protein, partial [Oricola sp.]|nr:twin-arginine translocation signal domain-containing protein [Oricola sp.]